MPKRSYRQYCAIAHALDIVGERWTLLIVRELLMGPKRFTDLLNGLPGIGTNLLSSRLRELEESDILERRTLPPPAASAVYDLTELGHGLESVIAALHRWGSKTQAAPDKKDQFRPEWSILAMQYAFRPELAKGLSETYEYRIGNEVFHARIEDGSIETRQGFAQNPDLIITTDPETYSAIAMQQVALVDAVNSGDVAVEGDADTLKRSAAIFGLPT